MAGMLTVFRKEIVDNFYDRRTLFTSLLFGPLFGPLMFALMTGLIINRTIDAADEALELPVVGAEHAPNLVAFLEQNNVELKPAPDDPESVVRDGTHDVVLIIPDDYPQRFRAGEPARLQLVIDQSDSRAAKNTSRARRLLSGYSARLGTMRLQARGVSSMVTQPIMIEDIDVSTPTGRSVLILGMMTYFILFSMLIGGMYLAIDATAGERERGSLEPLLTLPVARHQLILGKIAATCFYMLISLILTVTLFSIVLRFVPLEVLGMNASFSAGSALHTIVVMMPFILVGAGLMTVVASFTHSYKEAQTWLSAILIVPTLPILIAAVQSLKPAFSLMSVPSLSQHLLITEIIKNEAVPISWTLLSIASTTLLGAVLIWLATRLYQREAILG
ncbi:MAG: ABC transporter permease [Gammaproteobacteria bacterium]|nr:ABC transporter permease [Gammaproteobacteria bacterium]